MLVPTTCKRCGRQLYTGNRSLYGNEALKAKYERICSGCMTPQEKADLYSHNPLKK